MLSLFSASVCVLGLLLRGRGCPALILSAASGRFVSTAKPAPTYGLVLGSHIAALIIQILGLLLVAWTRLVRLQSALIGVRGLRA